MSISVYAKNRLNKTDSNDAWTKLFELVPEGSRVLDVGCSSGNFGAELIKNKSCEVVGIDINEDDVKLAKKNLNEAHIINIENDAISHLGKYDVIFMADIIEHLLNPIFALVKLKKLLKENGIIIFSVPNMSNISVRLELLVGRFEYTEYGLLDETHLHYYDKVELENVLNSAGFSVKEYNNTIRNIPDKFVEAQLNKVGLKVTPQFLDYTKKIDLITFQFIGIATVAAKKNNTPLKSKTPYDFVSQQIDAMKAEYMNELEESYKNMKEMETILSEKEKQITLLQQKLINRISRKIHRK